MLIFYKDICIMSPHIISSHLIISHLISSYLSNPHHFQRVPVIPIRPVHAYRPIMFHYVLSQLVAACITLISKLSAAVKRTFRSIYVFYLRTKQHIFTVIYRGRPRDFVEGDGKEEWRQGRVWDGMSPPHRVWGLCPILKKLSYLSS